jgi:signal recognition particle subunit SRP54
MFESLSARLQGVTQRLRGKARITEADLDESLREIRLALLEADVNFKVVKEFVARVRERALGANVLNGVNPGQQIVKIVHDELVAVLGGERHKLQLEAKPSVLMMVGLQGSGKTTTAAKLALKLKGEGRQTRLIAADVYRPAAIDQLETLGKQLDVPVYSDRSTKDVVKIAKAGLDQSRRERDRVVIVDTAGRLQIDEDMMQELDRLKKEIKPDEILLVADGMTGQEAVKIAQGFHQRLTVTGVILTKMDGDARGGAALSVYGVTKVPIKYIGVGEKPEALEEFHPERMAGRILQQGDIVSLVEKAQTSFDAEEAKRMEKKVRKEGMDLEDFLSAMKQMERMGPIEGLLKMLPGVNAKALKQVREADPDGKRMKHAEAIVLSMTKQERKNPGIMNGPRRARVAKGSGRPVSEVNRLLDQFKQMQQMMKKVAKGGRPPMMPFR